MPLTSKGYYTKPIIDMLQLVIYKFQLVDMYSVYYQRENGQ